MDGSWVELRVHGVSGTPPESLLATPDVHQVAGDDYSRFFRPDTPPQDGHVLEAYHWGRFTSGSWRQSLTLLLIPFGMVNATQYMLPDPRDDRRSKTLHAVAGACLRAIALLLTALFTFALCLILIDLVGWRWADKTRLLKSFPDGVVLAAAVLAAAGAFWLLSLLGKSGNTRLPAGPTDAQPGTESRLGDGLYDVSPDSPVLRSLHRAVGLGAIAVLADLARTGMDPGYYGGPLRICLVVVLGLVCLAVVLLGDPERAVSVSWGAREGMKEGWQRLVGRLSPWVVVLTGALVVVEACLVLQVERPAVADASDERLTATLRLVNYDRFANDLMYAGVAALVVLLVVLVLLNRRVRQLAGGSDLGPDRDAFRPYAKGMTPFLLAALAVFIGIGFSAGAATAVASALDLNIDQKVETQETTRDDQVETVTTDVPDQAQAGTTPMLDRVAFAWGITVIELVAIAAFVLIRKRRSRPAYLEAVATAYAEPPEETTVLPDGWAGRVAGAMYIARLKNLLPGIVITVVVVGMLISAVQAYESFGCDSSDCRTLFAPLGWLSQPRSDAASLFLINLGAWVFVAGSGAVVTVSRGAFKDSGLRRGINVIWDIFGFWPHTVHPFCPRPYSRWTVVELRNRVRYHLNTGHPDVVLAAHSQGSIISFASLMLLAPEERDRVALLTCGSQLRVIYPRAFPAYFSFDAVSRMFEVMDGRWVNLYRGTDPLAGPVLSWRHGGEFSRHFPLPQGEELQRDDWPLGEHRTRISGNDWRLIDPIPYDAEVETGPVAVIHGHHDFWLDPAWQRAIVHLRAP